MITLTVQLTDDQLADIAENVAQILKRDTSSKPEPWLTVEQAAQHLAMSTSQVYQLTHKRHTTQFPVHKNGSRSYFKATELDAWRLNHERTVA